MSGPMPTGFFLHPASSLHDPGWGHPDHQGRLRALSSAVSKDMLALHDKVAQSEARSATEEELLRVHTPEHLELIRSTTDRALEEERSIPLDSDTRISGASWDAAVGSCGAVLSAVEAMDLGHIRTAFVAARPPGHHASADRAMGFCLMNHLAVGIRFVQDQGLARRVLVVDLDLHHGNGTQEIFYRDPEVFYLSLHQHPHFPGTGRKEERGEGPGEGTTLNVPLPPGASRDTYEGSFMAAIEEVRRCFEPEFVFLSVGFDVLGGDSGSGFGLGPEDLHRFTRVVMELADDTAGGRIISVLEGGYALDTIGAGVVEVVRALAGLESKVGG